MKSNEITMLDSDFKKIIKNIKEEIINTQIKTVQVVNSNLILLYFRLGKILYDNYKYGNKFIEEIARTIKIEFPNSYGFSVRNLKYMKKFYYEYKNDKVVQQLVAQVSWSHNLILMSKVKTIDDRKKYIDAIIKYGWSRNTLLIQIENNYHKRIGNSNNNFNELLPKKDSDLVNELIKDPYIFDFISLNNDYKEQELEKALLEKIKDVLLELGKGFSFIGNQYKISTENNDYFIDLLFYHLDLRCYVVVELKTTIFKPEYIGQISFYVKAIDKTLKKEFDNPTIGLLLCKEKDKLTVEWALETSNVPVGVSSFELNNYISKDVLENLPTEEDFNKYIEEIEI